LVRHGANDRRNATIVCGVSIGHDAFVAAGSVVTRDVDSHALVAGNPRSASGGLHVRGATRRVPAMRVRKVYRVEGDGITG